MRAGAIVVLMLLAVGAGNEAMYRSEICRDAIGRCCGRGHLLALINGRGIYESDARRENAADQYLAGRGLQPGSPDAISKRLIASENVRQLSRYELLSDAELRREFGLHRYQFGDESAWQKRQREAGVSSHYLRKLVDETIRDRKWLEHSITRPGFNEQALRDYYAQHLHAFTQPVRFRASHIFLATPPGTLPEVVEAKKNLIDSLAARLRGGEEFESLVWEASEDEATKPRGGDLGYLAEQRIPADFFRFVSQLKIGEPPKTFRSILGFHLVRLTEIKASRQIPFEEARPEIVAALTNIHRQQAVEILAAQLGGSSALRTGWFWN
jgi:parvulin-like peptidyl-prolyl isomerase